MTATRWQAVAALVDPVRRSLYEHVRRQGRPVTREAAADAIAISRTLTAFHLDKLVDAGLLRARYEARTDQPRGRGRAPKVYEATVEGLSLTVPPRRYELVGEILADAIAAEPTDAGDAAEHIAYDHGRRTGETRRVEAEAEATAAGTGQPEADTTTPGAGQPSDVTTGEPALDDGDDGADELIAAYAALTDLGFEPRIGGPDDLWLGNCPFHALAVRQPELICGINQAFIGGLLAGLGTDRLCAELRPRPGACCVRVARTGATTG